MKIAELAREMREAFREMKRRDVDQLVRLDVPEILIEHFQMVGLARVREDRSGMLYDPDPGARWAYITPVCIQYADTAESTCAGASPLIGNLVDLVAWSEKAPERWRLRVGAASWLGCIPPQCCSPAPVRVWRSPFAWLQNRCKSIVLLTAERAEIYRLLAGCSGGIIAEDRQHAGELRRVLERPWPSPRVCAGNSSAAVSRRAA